MIGTAKRYYWLKLQEDFFSSPKIKKLRRIAGGDTYTVIYLKMQLLSIKNGGIIEYQGIEQTFAEELALILDEDEENVKVTLAFLLSQGLIEQSESNSYLITQAAENIGSESESASRVRAFRSKADPKTLHCNATSLQCNENVTLDKDRDRDKENDYRRHTRARAQRDDEGCVESVEMELRELYEGDIDTLSADERGKLHEAIVQHGSKIVEDAILRSIENGARSWSYVEAAIETQVRRPDLKPEYR